MELVETIWTESGIYQVTAGQAIMLVVCLVLLYLGIARKFEPLLLVTIGFGGLLSNIPGAGVADARVDRSREGVDPHGLALADELPLDGSGVIFDVSPAGIERRTVTAADHGLQTRCLQHPVGVFAVQPGVPVDPLRLEPNENLDAFRVRVIADGPETAWEPFGIDLPRADLWPATLLDVPAGVHPPVVQLQPLLEIAVDEFDLVLFVRFGHLGELMRTARVQHGQWPLRRAHTHGA